MKKYVCKPQCIINISTKKGCLQENCNVPIIIHDQWNIVYNDNHSPPTENKTIYPKYYHMAKLLFMV